MRSLIRRIGAAALAAFFLAGCGLTPQGDALRAAVTEGGRTAAAAALENAEWWQCRASPVGAILDRYCKSQDTCEAWHTLCRGSAEVTLFYENSVVP